jgi:hypothetical protein
MNCFSRFIVPFLTRKREERAQKIAESKAKLQEEEQKKKDELKLREAEEIRKKQQEEKRREEYEKQKVKERLAQLQKTASHTATQESKFANLATPSQHSKAHHVVSSTSQASHNYSNTNHMKTNLKPNINTPSTSAAYTQLIKPIHGHVNANAPNNACENGLYENLSTFKSAQQFHGTKVSLFLF